MSTSKSDRSERDTFYVLVTGANSGLGLEISIRLLYTFLLTRPSNQHIYLIPSTRSQSKADATIRTLEAYVDKLADGTVKPDLFYKTALTSSTRNLTPAERALFKSRVTLDTLLLDLCDLKTVYKAAHDVLPAKVPRLDAVILNAGIGGWSGVDWSKVLPQLFKKGIVSLLTRPEFKKTRVGALAPKQTSTEKSVDEPPLGEVFCANVLGHYTLTHELLPLLERESASPLMRGRVVWTSSEQAEPFNLNFDDIQGIKSENAYESSKRLIDVLVLGQNSSDAKPHFAKWLAGPEYSTPHSQIEREISQGLDKSMVFVSAADISDTSEGPSQSSLTSSPSSTTTTPPRILLSHPGIAQTTIMPLHALLVYAQIAVIYIARFVGSRWHVNTAAKGSVAAAWLALESDEALDAVEGEKTKWGSACNRWGKSFVDETHVEGYGFKGEDMKDEAEAESFARQAGVVWRKMEECRETWDGLLR